MLTMEQVAGWVKRWVDSFFLRKVGQQTYTGDLTINDTLRVRNVGLNVAPSSAAQLDVVASGAAVRGLRVKAAASPSVNLAEFALSSGAIPTYVDTNGALNLARDDFLANLRSSAGTLLGQIYNSAILYYSRDIGTAAGTHIQLARNNNGSTPAAGYINIFARTGTGYRIWPDNTGVLRINTADPTNANDTAGTVVGAQTSYAESKSIASDLSDLAEVMQRIQIGAEAVRRWRYRSGAFGGQIFESVVTDYAPDYGMDRDAEHPQGKALNEPTILGDLLRMMASLAARVEQLEQKWQN